MNLWEDNDIELILAGVVTRRYTLLSDTAFMITLAPPKPAKTKPPARETAAARATREVAEKKAANVRKAHTDRVGNLGDDGAAAWALPMRKEGGRSSIIRRHVQVTRGPAAPEDGILMDSWVLASRTSFAQGTRILAKSYYGAQSDVGTPGFRAGGALPVELSHFRPERQKDSGAVVITWSTQSELNNAGFFIKRRRQRDGEFKVVNATMILGAGTTSEKQFYTYTDTTAQANVVYYYQIEDVSLDGNRRTLTRGIRLKGHIGAAGKAAVLWGELKVAFGQSQDDADREVGNLNCLHFCDLLICGIGSCLNRGFTGFMGLGVVWIYRITQIGIRNPSHNRTTTNRRQTCDESYDYAKENGIFVNASNRYTCACFHHVLRDGTK